MVLSVSWSWNAEEIKKWRELVKWPPSLPSQSWIISPWTKWLPFLGRHFQMHFREWKILYFDLNFTKVCPEGCNWQCTSIGLDNGLAPNRQQAIIWTNADTIHWCLYAALGGDELNLFKGEMWCSHGSEYDGRWLVFLSGVNVDYL